MSRVALIMSVVDHLPQILAQWVSLLTLQRICLTATVASTIYALVYALGAVRIMQDLLWYSAYFVPEGSERDIRVHEGGKEH
jgi:hypothetical protein